MRSILLAALVVLVPGTVRADRLAELLAAGRTHGLPAAEARAVADQADAAAALGRAPLWPTITIGASYQRNQHASLVPLGTGTITIVPVDQLEATAALRVPLFDLAARRKARLADAEAHAARTAVDIAVVDHDRAIVRAYYAWVGGSAAVATARSARAAGGDNLAVVEQRAAAQLASPLDVARAQAAVAEADATIASAELVVATARRQLASATGVAIDDVAPALPAALEPEPALASWLADATTQPEVIAARAEAAVAAARVDASQATLWPTVTATVSERITNAAGFGEPSSATVGIAASWSFGLAAPRQVALDRAAARVTAARAATTAQATRDRIIDAWNQVAARRATVVAAAAQATAARLGAATARQRFAAGTGTQLDVTLAQRDALAAELAEVSARAELAADRALLRLAAGRPVTP